MRGETNSLADLGKFGVRYGRVFFPVSLACHSVTFHPHIFLSDFRDQFRPNRQEGGPAHRSESFGMLQALSGNGQAFGFDAGAHAGPEAFLGLSRRPKLQPAAHGTADFQPGMAHKACLAPSIWEGGGKQRTGDGG